MVRRATYALLALGVLAAPARADTCSAVAVRDSAIERLGRDAFERVGIAVDTDCLTGTITIPSGATRTVSAASPNELVDAMVLVLVMIADADANAESSISPVPPPEPPPAMPPPPIPASQSRVRTAPALVARVGVGVVAGDVDATSALGVRVSRRAMSVEVVATMQSADELAVGPGQVTIGLAALGADVCARIRPFAACLTGTAGAWTGRSEGLFDARTVRLPYLAAGTRVSWAYSMSAQLSVELAAGLDVGLLTSRFLVDQMPVWTSPRVSANGSVSAIVQIP